MIALSIDNIKIFMNKFLNSEAFDTFYVEEAVITTFNRFEINGRTETGFYSPEELQNTPALGTEFSLWQTLRPICFQLMKGKHTPLSFQFVLQAGESFKLRLLQSPQLSLDPSLIKSLNLIIRFENNKLLCVTGTAFHTFVPDKSLDQIWDKAIKKSFLSLGLDYTEQ